MNIYQEHRYNLLLNTMRVLTDRGEFHSSLSLSHGTRILLSLNILGQQSFARKKIYCGQSCIFSALQLPFMHLYAAEKYEDNSKGQGWKCSTSSKTFRRQLSFPEHFWSAKLCKFQTKRTIIFSRNYHEYTCEQQINKMIIPKDKAGNVRLTHGPSLDRSLSLNTFCLQSFENSHNLLILIKKVNQSG